MATGEPRDEKEYQDSSVPRGTSARGRYLNLTFSSYHLGPEAQIHNKDNVPREPYLFAIRRER